MPDKEEEVDACGRATSASETRSVEDELQYRDVDRPRIDHVDHSPATHHTPPEVTSGTEPAIGDSLESSVPSHAFAALSLLGTTSTGASPPRHGQERNGRASQELSAGRTGGSVSPSSSNLDTCQAEDPKSPVGSPRQKRAEGSGVHEPDTTGPAKPPVPADFCCPISMDIMRDPVLVATGQTYDKVCIEKWLNSGRRTCPKTGVKLRHMELTPNIALRNIIQDWATKNNVELKAAATVPAPYNAATENISNGHDEIIWAITKRDRRFFSASADRTVRVWDAVYGRCLHVLEGHQRPVLSLSATDTHLFSGSYDHTIRAWDMGSMRLVKSMQGHTDAVRALKVVGDRLFSGSYDGSVRAWSTASLLPEGTMRQHKGPVRTLVHSGRCIFSGSYDHTICAWNTDTLALEGQLGGHTDSVRALAETESLVFSGSDDTTIRAWDSSTLQHVSTFEGHTDNVRVLAASPTHPRMLFSGSWDKTVRVWDTRGRSCVRVLIGHTEAVLALAVGRTRLATGSYDSMVRFWDLATLQCVRTARGHSDAVRVIEADGDSFVSGAYDGAIGMW